MNSSDEPSEKSTAPRHPIAVVAERTGLSPDVLRVWERRYRAVEPTRGAGGHRLYSDSDIERLRLLHGATSAGRSIGQVARLPTDALSRMVLEDTTARSARAAGPAGAGTQPARPTPDVVDQAMTLASALRAPELEHLLRRSAAQFGLVSFIEDVAMPLLRRIGDLWHAGQARIAEEHLTSALVHDILSESMRAMMPRSDAPAVLVATPAGERHAIGAALVGAAAAAEGWRVVYLGADLPAEEIADAARATGARVVALSLTYVHDRDRMLDEVRALRARLPAGISLVVGGAAASRLSANLAESGIRVGRSLADLSALLDETVMAGAA